MAVHNSMSQRIAAVSEEEWPLEGGTWSARRDSEKKSRQNSLLGDNDQVIIDEREGPLASFTYLPVVAEDD